MTTNKGDDGQSDVFFHFPPVPTVNPASDDSDDRLRRRIGPPRNKPLSANEVKFMPDNELIVFVLAATSADEIFGYSCVRAELINRHKALRMRLHPDKCSNARAVEAFKKIDDLFMEARK